MAVSYLARRDLTKRSTILSTLNLGGIIAIFIVFSSMLQIHLEPALAGIVVLLLSGLVFSTCTLTTKILLFSGRKREIAVLRALGAKKSAIMMICIGESILMGLGGSLLGSFFGILILLVLKTLTETSFSGDLVFLATFLGIAATLTSGVYSTKRSMDGEVGEALRHERW